MKRIASIEVARFLLDHNVSSRLLAPLRRTGHVATALRDRLDVRATDEFVLLYAAQYDWVLVTHNRRDFELLHRAWRRWSTSWGSATEHSGILVIPQQWPEARAARELSDAAGYLTLPNSMYRYTPQRVWEATTVVEYELLEQA